MFLSITVRMYLFIFKNDLELELMAGQTLFIYILQTGQSLHLSLINYITTSGAVVKNEADLS